MYFLSGSRCTYKLSGPPYFLSKIKCLFENSFHSSTNHFSQPTFKTFSQPLNKSEIAPGIDVYRQRRRTLMEMIFKNSHKPNSPHLVAIPSATVLHMTEDIPYPFRQNTDFLYLSGCKEPNSLLIAHLCTDSDTPECTLFIPKPSDHSIRWEGPKMDLKTTTDFLGVTQTLYAEELEKYLHSFTRSFKDFTLWYDYKNPRPNSINRILSDFIVSSTGHVSVESPSAIIQKIRILKSDVEIELMRKTCRIGALSLKEVMKFSYPSVPEMHLQAKMDFECRLRGADFLAFPPVVAGAERANTIHYIENNNIVNDSEMVLMDSGCECHGYASDITRTWPVNGEFTTRQKEIYELVLSVQEELIELCRPGEISIDILFKVMLQKLGSKLQELGLIPKDFSHEAAAKAAYEFCPHNVGHYLGMDVHDTNLVSKSIMLQPGMVITIEPGVYIPKDNKKLPEPYRGLCVRIEDDILITNNGCENLTYDCPKYVQEIEKLIKN